MKKALFILLTLLLAVPASQGLHAQSWRRVSRDIWKQQKYTAEQRFAKEMETHDKSIPVYKSKGPNVKRKYDLRRRRIDVFGLLDVDVRSDTIYIVEDLCDIFGNLYIYSTIFSRKGLLSYHVASETTDSHKKGSLVVDSIPEHYRQLLRLTAKWDLEGLQREEEINKTLTDFMGYTLTRVIFKDGKYEIECTHVDPFFNLKRDDLDYYYYRYEMKDVHELLDELFK